MKLLSRRTDLDLTNGPILKTIILFAIPLILANFVSMLFNAMDLMVLSWFTPGGYEVASVGTTSSLTHLLENIATGLCTGVSIILARLIGEGNTKRAQSVISTAIITSVGLGGVIAIVGSIISRPFLLATNCPPECIDHATLYATVYFIGMPFLLLYHYAAAIIRVGGDSQRPLYYMLIAGICNLVLNTVFCWILPQKVMAVALATALSKGLAAYLALRHLSRNEGVCQWNIKRTSFNIKDFKTMILYGLPTAVTGCLYPIANMQIASGINSYGANFVAGSTASQQYEQMVASYNVGLSATTLTMMGQNIGAKKPKRVYRVFFYVLILEFCLIFGTASILCTFGETLLPIFCGHNAESIAAGMLRMKIMLFSYCLLHVPTAPTIQAFGHPTLQTAINIAGILGVRTLWMQVVYGRYIPATPTNVFLSFTVSYIFTQVAYIICTAVLLLRYRKGKYKQKV